MGARHWLVAAQDITDGQTAVRQTNMLFKVASSGIVAAVGEHSTHLLKTKVPVIGVLFKVFFKVTESGNTTHKNSYLRKNRFNLYYAYSLKLLIRSENKIIWFTEVILLINYQADYKIFIDKKGRIALLLLHEVRQH